MPETTIDPTILNELQDTAGQDFVVELVDAFFEEAPQMLLELRTALEAKDGDSFRRAAHSLKSNASTFGALRLAEVSRDLELNDLPDNAESLDMLQAEYDRAAAELAALVNTKPGA